MKITNLKFINNKELPQGSNEWLEVRSHYGMASEAAAVMEQSPWMPSSPLQLYEVKTGKVKVVVTEAMQRGTEFEPVARKALEMMMLCSFEPVVVTCEIDGVPLGASLDGYNQSKSLIVEIKIPMKGEKSKLWEILTEGNDLPIQYHLQTQQQLLVTGAKELILWIYDINTHSAIKQQIKPDAAIQQEIFEAWKKYWSYDGPPPAGEKDFITRKDDEWVSLATEWCEVHSQLDTLSTREKELRQSLIDISEDKSILGGGIRFKRSEGKGRISYAKIPELDDVDLELYRGKSIIKFYITEVK